MLLSNAPLRQCLRSAAGLGAALLINTARVLAVQTQMGDLAMDNSYGRDTAGDFEGQSPHQESTDCKTVPLLFFLCIIVHTFILLETIFPIDTGPLQYGSL